MTGPFDQHGYYIDNITVRNILPIENNITGDEELGMNH